MKFLACVVGVSIMVVGLSLKAQERREATPAGVERARSTVKMLDDLYKTAVVSISKRYIEDQGGTPAALVAKDVFEAMHKKGWHSARLVDATGRPKNKENVAKTDFEKKAVEQMKSGKPYYEEVGDKDGKPVFRAATIVPAVMRQCASCHAKKEGDLLGTIVYEVPIR
jgi:hypothetical protein